MRKVKIKIDGVEAEAVFVWDTDNLDDMALHAVCVGSVDILPALMLAAAAGSSGRQAVMRKTWLVDSLCEMIAEELNHE